MPASCWGRYGRIAVIELADGHTDASRIDIRDRAIKRIVELWDRCHVGKTDRGEFQKRLKEAQELCDQLNAAVNIAHALDAYAEGDRFYETGEY